MPWGAVIGAVATYVGGRQANKGQEKAADAQAESNRLAIEEQKRQFDLTRGDMKPWMDAGAGALGQQQAFLAGDWSGFKDSPDYAWAVDQGFRGLNRDAASRGALFSGGTDLDRMAFGQGLALQNSNSYFGKLAGLSGTGNQTAGQLGQLGANSASNIGNLLQNSGAARASSYQNIGNNQAQMWGNIGAGINQFGQGRGWWGG